MAPSDRTSLASKFTAFQAVRATVCQTSSAISACKVEVRAGKVRATRKVASEQRQRYARYSAACAGGQEVYDDFQDAVDRIGRGKNALLDAWSCVVCHKTLLLDWGAHQPSVHRAACRCRYLVCKTCHDQLKGTRACVMCNTNTGTRWDYRAELVRTPAVAAYATCEAVDALT